MGIQDLFITPIIILCVLFVGYLIRQKKSDEYTKRYFFPALGLKILGAISVGLIYQFYYSGGDTFTYFTHGSSHIWDAFLDSPLKGIKMIFASGEYDIDTYQYSGKIWVYRDLPSYFVVRVAAIFGIFTLNTYSSIAVLFAFFSFLGLWSMYRAFMRFFPSLHFEFAIALFFIPSVFFWGSGVLKDTLTLGALGFLTYGCIRLIFEKRGLIIPILIILVSAYIIYSIKIYILLCFLPAIILWVFFFYMGQIKSVALRIVSAPLIGLVAVAVMYVAVIKVGEENKRYNIETLSFTAESTARWLSYVSEIEGGSGYTLGDFDYSPAGVVRKFPRAIWVSLYQPYLWQARNPVMLLSALEAFLMLLMTLYIFRQTGFLPFFRYVGSKPEILFCFLFSLAFAGAVGITTYNFGSLVRYKIPMIPFFLMGLFLVRYYTQKDRQI